MKAKNSSDIDKYLSVVYDVILLCFCFLPNDNETKLKKNLIKKGTL